MGACLRDGKTKIISREARLYIILRKRTLMSSLALIIKLLLTNWIRLSGRYGDTISAGRKSQILENAKLWMMC